MGQENLTAFDAGVDDRDPVAWSYELKKTAGEDGRELQGWKRRVQRDEPDPDGWRETDSEYYHFRNIVPLRYSRELHPDDALAYEFEYEADGDGTGTGLAKVDPRGPNADSVIDCTPLVPISDE